MSAAPDRRGAAPDPVHGLTLPDVLAEHRRSRPRTRSVVCGEVRLTYPELDERTDRLAGALADAGVGRGDRVVWLGQNCHRLIETWLAGAKIGAVLVPANWRQSASEMVTLLADARPVVVIWQSEEIGPVVEAARSRWDGPARWLHHDAAGDTDDSYETFLYGSRSAPPDPHSLPAASSEEPVIQLYTGAFGGTPNGALLSHRAILAQASTVAMVQRITGETAYLNAGPMFHMATLMTTFATFAMGGTNVLTRRVDAEELCRVIEAERCNYGFVMGPTATEIMEVNRAAGTTSRACAPSAGARPGTPWSRSTTARGVLHPAGYGQTEVTGMLTYNALGISTEGTSGRPSPWVQVRIVDPDGAECPRGRPARSWPVGRSSPTVTTTSPTQCPAVPGRVVAHRGPRAPPRGRLDHLRGAVGPHREVRRRNIYPPRSRDVSPNIPP